MAEQAFLPEDTPPQRGVFPPSDDRDAIRASLRVPVIPFGPNRQPMAVVEPEVKRQLHVIVPYDKIAGALALYYGQVESSYNVPERIIDGFSGRVSQLMQLYNNKMYPEKDTRTPLLLDDEITVLRSTLIKSDEWTRRPFSSLLEGRDRTERASLVQARNGMLRRLAMVASREPEYTDR